MTTGRTLVAWLVLALAWLGLPTDRPVLAGPKAPMEIGGFRLGTFIDDYEFISYKNYYNEVVVPDIPGFRRGAIAYGLCAKPGQILRIKLKYVDRSRKFYDALFKRYKQRFGTPDQFIGDTFGIITAWKWEFFTKEGERIKLVLQYNSKDPDESLGTVVKLSLPDRIRSERRCFNRMCQARMEEQGLERQTLPADYRRWGSREWDLILPR